MSTNKQRPVLKRTGVFLPHWTLDGVPYHVVFRLADSVPSAVLATWQEQRDSLLKDKSLTPANVGEIKRLIDRNMDAYLDEGHGTCLLMRPRCAGIVRDTLQSFRGERYHLHAWCLMPNHVHAIVEPFQGFELASIIHAWKTCSGSAIGTALGKTGPVWHRESTERMIRKPESFDRAVQTILNNPERSGLRYWTWVSEPAEAYVRTPRWLVAS